MIKLAFVLIIVAIAFVRWFFAEKKQKPSKYILISCFIQTIPFGYNKNIYEILKYDYFGDREMLGAFGSGISIEVTLIFSFLFFLLGLKNIKTVNEDKKRRSWLYVFLLACVVSIFNPSNERNISVLVLVSILFQLFLFLKIVESNFSYREVMAGTFDGLIWASLLQLSLAICYPVLNLKVVTTLFRGEDAAAWTNRREGYQSATGTFSHPGNLAMFSLFCLLFFLSSYFNKYKESVAKIFIAINLMIIVLTFSRTTYISVMAVIALLFVIHKRKTALFSFKNIALALAFFGLILFLLYLTPLSDLFLKSDAELQFDNRFNHWILGFQIWESSKWIGVGLNSHVYYMSHAMGVTALEALPIFDFLISNPIHNIHMIVLAETGIIGLILWVYFFISKMNLHSRYTNTGNPIQNVFNLTCVSILASIFIYGFFGWTPFSKEIYTLAIYMGYFAYTSENKSIYGEVKLAAE